MRGHCIIFISLWRGPFFRDWQIMHLAQRGANFAKTPLACLQNMMTKRIMRTGQRVAHNRKTAVPDMGPLPLAQRFLREIGLQITRGRTIQTSQPIAHRLVRTGLDRHIHQAGFGGSHITRNHRTTARLKIRRARQIKPVKPRQRLFHRRKIDNLFRHRHRVLLFQGFIKRRNTVVAAQIFGQTIHHINVLQVFIGHIKRRLPHALQRRQKPDLKRLQRFQMDLEFLWIKLDFLSFGVANIGQLPLPRGRRNLPADKTFDGISGQNDLGTAPIRHADI